MKKIEMVNHPGHYAKGDIECIDAMKSAFGISTVQSFCIVNAFKYVWRCREKDNMVQDLEKAKWYINKAIDLQDGIERVSSESNVNMHGEF